MFSAISSILHIPYNWLTKLLYLSILIGLWALFVGPVQNDLATFMNYVLNLTLFRFIPEQSIVAMEQLFIFFTTIKLLIWISRTEHAGLPSHGHQTSKR